MEEDTERRRRKEENEKVEEKEDKYKGGTREEGKGQHECGVRESKRVANKE